MGARVVDWHNPPEAAELGGAFDVVLACDVLYEVVRRNRFPLLRFVSARPAAASSGISHWRCHTYARQSACRTHSRPTHVPPHHGTLSPLARHCVVRRCSVLGARAKAPRGRRGGPSSGADASAPADSCPLWPAFHAASHTRRAAGNSSTGTELESRATFHTTPQDPPNRTPKNRARCLDLLTGAADAASGDDAAAGPGPASSPASLSSAAAAGSAAGGGIRLERYPDPVREYSPCRFCSSDPSLLLPESLAVVQLRACVHAHISSSPAPLYCVCPPARHQVSISVPPDLGSSGPATPVIVERFRRLPAAATAAGSAKGGGAGGGGGGAR